MSGEKITLSNSGTIVPGSKEPNDPPVEPEGQEEYSLASSANVDVLVDSLPMIIEASSSVFTKICLAVALIASGGAPYFHRKKGKNTWKKEDEERFHCKGFYPVILTSSFVNALEKPSKNPIFICVDLERPTAERVVRCWEKASANCLPIEILKNSDRTFIFLILMLLTMFPGSRCYCGIWLSSIVILQENWSEDVSW